MGIDDEELMLARSGQYRQTNQESLSSASVMAPPATFVGRNARGIEREQNAILTGENGPLTRWESACPIALTVPDLPLRVPI